MTNPAAAALIGLHDGLLALAWLAGAALPVAGAALILAAAVVATRGARHRVTSARLHRAARRAGRTPYPGEGWRRQIASPHGPTQRARAERDNALHLRPGVIHNGTEQTLPRPPRS